ncbi:MAG TPA: methyltransferase domain-containing protein [Roseiflexaceae bacterium]|nr:methyltransferase domain-containing protein [Roseiflexaceae bacterium]
MTNPAIAEIRAYYERNTALFQLLSRGRQSYAIHRAVWLDQTVDYAAALRYVNDTIGVVLEPLIEHTGGAGLRLIDLGCGIGGTVIDLARRYRGSLKAIGISISPAQLRLAQHNAALAGVVCRFVEADYLQPPFGPCFDLAIAIESFIHAPAYRDAIIAAARLLAPGGQLIICDDFLAETASAGDRRVATFMRGWHAPGLTHVSRVRQAAAAAGLTLCEQRDLTVGLRLHPSPDRVAETLLQLTAPLPQQWRLSQSLIGSMALQQCLHHGSIRYQWLRFVRQ